MSRARRLASLLDVNGDVVSTALDNADQEVSQADVTQHEAALSITESQISDLGDYATSSELTTATANSSNWDTAFSWGDHGTEGYATTSYVDTEIGNVDLSTRVATSGDTMTGDLNFNDNVKVKFGAGDDLHIYHDGNNSYVQDAAGTGDLILRGANVQIQDGLGDTQINVVNNGRVALSYNSNERLETTSSGINVTGTVSATSFSGDGSNLTGIQTSPYDQNTSSTGFFALPRGTTAQRPGSPQNGYIRYNTDNDVIEEYRNGQWVGLSNVFEAEGGTETTATISGVDYKIHTFTSSGTFTVTSGSTNIEYVIVAGGGGTGTRWHAGGGGAGGYRSSVSGESSGGGNPAESAYFAGIGTYSVVVGAGGSGAPDNGNSNSGAQRGGTSSVFGISATGGGYGGTYNSSGQSGGSGGGSGGTSTNGVYFPGSGTSGQGYVGGLGSQNAGGGAGGGGGGAGQAGQAGTGDGTSTSYGGDGGDGVQSNITGTPTYRAGGGGGAGYGNYANRGIGGLGGGADGGDTGTPVKNGTANTGGGGGGNGVSTGDRRGGSGGSGIVIIRYAI